MPKQDNSVLKDIFAHLDSQIVYRNINSIKSNAKNARTHSHKQLKQIEKSIRTYGFLNPILIGEDSVIIAGHGRLAAVKEIGIDKVPTIELKNLSEAQKRAYLIADNRLAELAGWDEDLLRIELDYLTNIEIDFDVEITGFSTGEIDILLGADVNNVVDDPPPPPPVTPISKKGDIWQLGTHRLLCGNCLSPASLDRLMGDHIADMVITDAPYNVPIIGHARGLGKTKHKNFAMAYGELSAVEFEKFLYQYIGQLARVSKDGSLHYHFMDWRHSRELLTSALQVYDEFINLCVWVKSNAGMGSFYRSQHEFIFVFKKGKQPHINNVRLGQYGRYRTNVWSYPGVNAFGPGRDEALVIHPTVKPIQLISDAILDVTHRGDIVLDGFLGSGTTLLAAEKTGRVCYGIEIDPCYVDVALQRWIVITGEMPRLTTDGRTYEEVAITRTQHKSCGG